MAFSYFSGQGKLSFAKLSPTGTPGAFVWLGDMSDVSFTVDESKTDYQENYSGNRGVALTLSKNLVAKVSGKLLQFNRENYKLLMRGSVHSQAAGAVVDQVVGTATDVLAVGQKYSLGKVKIAATPAIQLVDSSPTPEVLTLGTNFSLDAQTGMIEILSIAGGPYVMPLIADFTAGVAESVNMFAGSNAEYWLRFDGVNTAVSGYPKVIAEWYKCSPSVLKDLALINDDRAEVDIEFSVLSDTSKADSAEYGAYGRLFDLAA
jgi:hypothetical protein